MKFLDLWSFLFKYWLLVLEAKGFPGGSVVKNLPAKAGDAASTPGSGKSPGEGNGNPRRYSCLENPMGRGAWRATVHGFPRVGHDLTDNNNSLRDPRLLALCNQDIDLRPQGTS